MDSNGPFHSLDDALSAMRFRVEEGRFALLGFSEGPEAADLALVQGDGPAQITREGGETTLLIPESGTEAALARHPDAAVERDLVWIRFEGAMAWDLVGFLALVTRKLAGAGVPVGAVCGYSRDHLFVGADHLPRARGALEELFGEAPAR